MLDAADTGVVAVGGDRGGVVRGVAPCGHGEGDTNVHACAMAVCVRGHCIQHPDISSSLER